MDNIEFIRADAAGGVFAILFVIISIIVSVVQANKEKRKREERMRKLQENGGEAPRPQAKPKQGRPTSIEDFLRELAGEKPASEEGPPAREPEPEPRQVQREWRASESEVESWVAEKKHEETPLESREIERQRQLAESVSRRAERRAASAVNDAYAIKNEITGNFFEDDHSEACDEAECEISVDLPAMSRHDLMQAFVFKEVLGSPVAMKTKGDQPPGLR